ncbi:hypothetical protein DPMN_099240 [Dreissena polymorpha]|uniref:Uncharacterized protein n=1 Tax=Dreissena polymorpha TaxID=45954 RepID=A0A9D4R728_DREPO|nr:hypothetical protein DPMN_099240 [Dreissena polymorpha]
MELTRPIFPEHGNYQCPVPSCSASGFAKLKNYNEHWQRVHVRTSRLYRCLVCPSTTYKLSKARNHTRSFGHRHCCMAV